MNGTIDSSRQAAARSTERVLLACVLGAGLALALAAAAPTALAARPADATPPLSGVVNVNTATPDQLQLLPGVGASRASAIVAYRKERGGFQKVEDLMEVKGIGASMLERMRPFVTVTGKTTARKL